MEPRKEESDETLRKKLTAALEDQFYPAQKPVATQLVNAIDRAGLLSAQGLRSTVDELKAVLQDEFTEDGASELIMMLRCAESEMKKTAKPTPEPDGSATIMMATTRAQATKAPAPRRPIKDG